MNAQEILKSCEDILNSMEEKDMNSVEHALVDVLLATSILKKNLEEKEKTNE